MYSNKGPYNCYYIFAFCCKTRSLKAHLSLIWGILFKIITVLRLNAWKLHCQFACKRVLHEQGKDRNIQNSSEKLYGQDAILYEAKYFWDTEKEYPALLRRGKRSFLREELFAWCACFSRNRLLQDAVLYVKHKCRIKIFCLLGTKNLFEQLTL